MKFLHIVAAAIVLCAFSAATLARPRVLEHSYEAVPSMISLPASETSELTVQSCDTCSALRLRASASTRYFIGHQQVTLEVLRKYLASNPESNLAVMRLKDTFDLSRVVVFVPASAK